MNLHESVEKKEPFYQPNPLSAEDITVTKGTKIVYCGRSSAKGSGAVHELALRKPAWRGIEFSVIGVYCTIFKITIDGQPDRRLTTAATFPSSCNYLWTFGDFECTITSSIPKVLEREQLPNRLPDPWPEDLVAVWTAGSKDGSVCPSNWTKRLSPGTSTASS